MEWAADVSAGDWVRERLDDPWRGTMHDFAPRGFAAYARVLHPASVQSLPDGEPLPEPAEWAALPWERIEALSSRIRYDRFGWADAAALLSTPLEPTTPWHRLLGVAWDAADREVALGDGRWLSPPDQGRLDDETLASLLPSLAAHTSDADAVYAAVWEGWGGLVGSHGYGSPTSALIGDVDQRHAAVLYTSLKDVFNRGFRKPPWRPGLLSDEISRGARLALPNRDHVLFRGRLRDLVEPSLPWREGATGTATSPSLLWPADRSWAIVTEVDADSTIVGGSADLVAAILATDGIEALAISEGAVLTGDHDGDGDGASR